MTGNTDTQKIRVAIVTFPIGMLSCVFAMQETLMVANYSAYRFGEQERIFDIKLVGASQQGAQSYFGTRIEQVVPLPAPDEVDLVLVPSGPPPIIDHAGLQAWLTANHAMREWVLQAHTNGAQIAATCTGSLLLANAGLLDGIPATTHWAIEQAAQQHFPEVHWRVDEALVEHGSVITAGGGNIYPVLLQQLIRQHLGNDIAMETSRMLLMESHIERQAVYRQGTLNQNHENPRMETMKQFVARNFRRALSLADLAQAVSLTERTLIRTCQRELGMTPMQFVQRVRIESVMHELQLTSTPVNQIVWDTGYEDISSFQRLFKRHTGLTMSEYRRRFGVKVYATDEQKNMTFEA